MIRSCKPREYNHDSGENPFVWILEETARIRQHNQRYNAEGRAARALANKPTPNLTLVKSLRSNVGNTVLLKNLDKACLDAAGEYVFEVAKARKL